MDIYALKKWERTQEIAKKCKVKITLKSSIEMTDKKGMMLGCLNTVDEAFAFLCGYEHSKFYRTAVEKRMK